MVLAIVYLKGLCTYQGYCCLAAETLLQFFCWCFYHKLHHTAGDKVGEKKVSGWLKNKHFILRLTCGFQVLSLSHVQFVFQGAKNLENILKRLQLLCLFAVKLKWLIWKSVTTTSFALALQRTGSVVALPCSILPSECFLFLLHRNAQKKTGKI